MQLEISSTARRKTIYSVIAGGILFFLSFLLVPETLPSNSSATPGVEAIPTLAISGSHTLELTTNPGQFGTSDSQNLVVETTNYTGYTMTIAPSTGESTELVNTTLNTATIPSISESTTATNFANLSTAAYGLSIDEGTNYFPVTSGATINTTSGPTDSTTGALTLKLGAKTQSDTPAGTYAKSFTISATANDAIFSIVYNKNTEDAVSNLPTAEETTISGINVNIPNKTPIREGYAFLGWATSSESQVGEYPAGSAFALDPETDNEITLYAVWGDSVTIVFDGDGYYFDEEGTIATNTVVYANACTNNYGYIGSDHEVLRSDNVDSSGNQIEPFTTDTNDLNPIIIPGADKLKIVLAYDIAAEGGGPGVVSITRGYLSDYNDYGRYYWTDYKTSGTETIIIDGDTATIDFEYWGTVDPEHSYGYYALVYPVYDEEHTGTAYSSLGVTCGWQAVEGSYAEPLFEQYYTFDHWYNANSYSNFEGDLDIRAQLKSWLGDSYKGQVITFTAVARPPITVTLSGYSDYYFDEEKTQTTNTIRYAKVCADLSGYVGTNYQISKTKNVTSDGSATYLASTTESEEDTISFADADKLKVVLTYGYDSRGLVSVYYDGSPNSGIYYGGYYSSDWVNSQQTTSITFIVPSNTVSFLSRHYHGIDGNYYGYYAEVYPIYNEERANTSYEAAGTECHWQIISGEYKDPYLDPSRGQERGSWYCDQTDVSSNYYGELMSDILYDSSIYADVTITGSIVDTATFNFNGNGGTASHCLSKDFDTSTCLLAETLTTQSVTSSYSISFNPSVEFDSEFIRDGYALVGWSTDPNATEPEYDMDDSREIYGIEGQTIDYYAVWGNYVLRYDANSGYSTPLNQGAIDASPSHSFAISDDIPMTSRWMRVFVGWSTNPDATEPEYQPGDTITVSVPVTTLYAVWKNERKIIYNANGGSDAPDNQIDITSDSSSTFTITSDMPTRANYYFMGWATYSSASTPSYYPGGTITVNSQTTLYAVWNSRPIYFITYDGNNADEGVMTNVKHINVGEGDSVQLYASNYSRDGYGFAGWSFDSAAQPGGSSTIYGPNAVITAPEFPGYYKETKLYAVWVKAEENVTMQTFDNSASPYSSAPKGKVIALRDERDDDVYAVAKLADGKWWMIENLRLDNTANITPQNTQSNNGSFGGVFYGLAEPEDLVYNSHQQTGSNSLYKADGSGDIAGINGAELSDIGIDHISPRFPRMDNSNKVDRVADPNVTDNLAGSDQQNTLWKAYSYGVYYTWAAAIADTTEYTGTTSVTTTSICPAGWRLPLGGPTDNEFIALDRALGGNGTNIAEPSSGALPRATTRWTAYPTNTVLSGGTYDRGGYNAQYWSATTNPSGESVINQDFLAANNFQLYSYGPRYDYRNAGSIIGFAYGWSKYDKDRAGSVRCIASDLPHYNLSVSLGTGVDSVTIDDTTYNSDTTLSLTENSTHTISMTPASGYELDSWTVSGTGASVASTSTQSTTFTMGTDAATLTANAKVIVIETTLDTGSNINVKLKALAGASNPNISTSDNNITTFQRADTLPSDLTSCDANTPASRVISTSSSTSPVCISFDSNTGTMYYYTEASDIYANADSSSMFRGLRALSTISDIGSWNTSNVTNVNNMFSSAGYNATSFSLDISEWDTPKVTDMSSMFSGAGHDATTWSIGDLSSWDTSKVTNMSGMFSGAGYSATTWSIGDLSDWDTSQATNMSSMFSGAGRNATTWSIGNLSDWDTSQVTDMSSMFNFTGRSATSFSLDLSGWDTSKVTSMSGMFSGAGYSATTWTVIISPTNGGGINNDTTHLYGSNSSTYAEPASGKTFTLAATNNNNNSNNNNNTNNSPSQNQQSAPQSAPRATPAALPQSTNEPTNNEDQTDKETDSEATNTPPLGVKRSSDETNPAETVATTKSGTMSESDGFGLIALVGAGVAATSGLLLLFGKRRKKDEEEQ